jgi:hypothetical protein
MATNGKWVVVFDDKRVVKNYDEGASEAIGYDISDDSLWNQSKYSNIWAIHYENTVESDQVEYRDDTPHSSLAAANLGDFQPFIDGWDAAHLTQLQSDWDNNNVVDENGVSTETEAEKIARLGARPTSYSS